MAHEPDPEARAYLLLGVHQSKQDYKEVASMCGTGYTSSFVKSRSDDTDHLLVPSTRRVAIYTPDPDSPLAANQLVAIQRYVRAMDWVTVAIVESDEQRLLDLATTRALDLVLCWRTSDFRRAESLAQELSVHGIGILAVAQSCTALME